MSNDNTTQLLNSGFTICSYDGASDQHIGYEVDMILDPKSKNPHCSKDGKNFNLLLEHKTEFTLTNFVVRKPFQVPCTSPIKTGALWLFSEKPDVEKFKEFDNFSMPSTNQVLHATQPNAPTLYFDMEDEADLQINLNPWKTGKFALIKFISSEMDADDANIDIGLLGFVGFEGDMTAQSHVIEEIPEEFGILPRKLKPGVVNELDREFLPAMRQLPFCLYFNVSNTPEILERYTQAAASPDYRGKVNFLVAGPTNELAHQIVESIFGVEPTQDFAFITSLASHKSYVHPVAQPITADSLSQFLADFIQEKLSPYVKSATRPENDRHPDHPELVILTANSFKELVLDSDNDVLVDVYADWCGPCVAIGPTIVSLAQILSGVENLAIAKFDCDVNDIDRDYFPEPSIPNIKFFPRDNKQNPIKYSGERNLTAFVKFIHEHTKRFDLDTMLAKATKVQALQEISLQARNEIEVTQKNLDKHGNSLAAEEVANINSLVDSLKGELKDVANATAESIKEKFDRLKTTTTNLTQIAKLAKEEAEKNSLKNVKKMHTDEEYKETIAQAKQEGRAVVVDFTATWCGPCKFIAPIFADLSVEHPDVWFLKVDVDELEQTAAESDVSCMPTFHVIKDGVKVAQLEGADPDELTDLITKNK